MAGGTKKIRSQSAPRLSKKRAPKVIEISDGSSGESTKPDDAGQFSGNIGNDDAHGTAPLPALISEILAQRSRVIIHSRVEEKQWVPPPANVDERLHQARNYLSDEDINSDEKFLKRHTEIEAYLRKLAENEVTHNVNVYNEVKAMLRVHQSRMDSQHRQFVRPARNRVIPRRSQRLTVVDTSSIAQLQQVPLRDDHPPFTIEQAHDHMAFVQVLHENTPRGEELRRHESEGFSSALRNPLLVKESLEETKEQAQDARFNTKATERGRRRAAVQIALRSFATNQEQHFEGGWKHRVLRLPPAPIPERSESVMFLAAEKQKGQQVPGPFKWTKKNLDFQRSQKDLERDVVDKTTTLTAPVIHQPSQNRGIIKSICEERYRYLAVKLFDVFYDCGTKRSRTLYSNSPYREVDIPPFAEEAFVQTLETKGMYHPLSIDEKVREIMKYVVGNDLLLQGNINNVRPNSYPKQSPTKSATIRLNSFPKSKRTEFANLSSIKSTNSKVIDSVTFEPVNSWEINSLQEWAANLTTDTQSFMMEIRVRLMHELGVLHRRIETEDFSPQLPVVLDEVQKIIRRQREELLAGVSQRQRASGRNVSLQELAQALTNGQGMPTQNQATKLINDQILTENHQNQRSSKLKYDNFWAFTSHRPAKSRAWNFFHLDRWPTAPTKKRRAATHFGDKTDPKHRHGVPTYKPLGQSSSLGPEESSFDESPEDSQDYTPEVGLGIFMPPEMQEFDFRTHHEVLEDTRDRSEKWHKNKPVFQFPETRFLQWNSDTQIEEDLFSGSLLPNDGLAGKIARSQLGPADMAFTLPTESKARSSKDQAPTFNPNFGTIEHLPFPVQTPTAQNPETKTPEATNPLHRIPNLQNPSRRKRKRTAPPVDHGVSAGMDAMGSGPVSSNQKGEFVGGVELKGRKKRKGGSGEEEEEEPKSGE